MQQIKENGNLVFIDNRYVHGINTPISRTDSQGNTHQIRQLQSGETFEIVKNFFISNETKKFIKAMSDNWELVEHKYYWILRIQK